MSKSLKTLLTQQLLILPRKELEQKNLGSICFYYWPPEGDIAQTSNVCVTPMICTAH
jgi:hypothetical protein